MFLNGTTPSFWSRPATMPGAMPGAMPMRVRGEAVRSLFRDRIPIQVADTCGTPVVEQDVTGLVVETEPDLVGGLVAETELDHRARAR